MGTVLYTTIDGEVIAEERNGVRSLYSPDALGSTLALLDNTQSKTDIFQYWPYGETRVHTGTNPTPLQHVGSQGYFRDSSRRSHVRARPLDTQKGRWLSQDPIGFVGKDYNLYRYVTNNPVTFTDPSGMEISPPNGGKWLTCLLQTCKGKKGMDLILCLGGCLGLNFIDMNCSEIVCFVFPEFCASGDPCLKKDSNEFDCQSCCEVTWYCCTAKAKGDRDKMIKCYNDAVKCHLRCRPDREPGVNPGPGYIGNPPSVTGPVGAK